MSLSDPADCRTNRIRDPTSILYQNVEETITLIDIPKSIAVAQSRHAKLISPASLKQPFPSTEPKSIKALAKIKENSTDHGCDEFMCDFIANSLHHIKENYSGPWCMPREVSTKTKKRKSDQLECENRPFEELSRPLLDQNVPELDFHSATSDNLSQAVSAIQCLTPIILPLEKVMVFKSLSCLRSNSVTNDQDEATKIHILVDHAEPSGGQASFRVFHIPPYSTFLLSTISEGIGTFLKVTPNFDFILLDPPWPNRSARRKGAYSTLESSSAIKDLLSSIPIDQRLSRHGLVGIWITNKRACREILTQKHGVLERWGLEIFEEWVWMKTTISGEPVTELTGLWRKPYEILLVCHRIVSRPAFKTSVPEVSHRAIAGVPGIHSGKPSLKGSNSDTFTYRVSY
ncbi:MAG: hypothetical protein M1829_004898 [Trizodia sp. TS-e1964]|nr:MAG: hypothetical protein M1829_004898 [Trizodia sp. TS-e1964]